MPETNSDSARAVAVLDDLFFTVKILDAAKRAGLTLKCVKTAEAAMEHAVGAAVVILDLNYAAADPVRLIAALRSGDATKNVPLLGYVSHVQVELKAEAQAAGCEVLARSVFSDNLAQRLTRYASRS